MIHSEAQMCENIDTAATILVRCIPLSITKERKTSEKRRKKKYFVTIAYTVSSTM